MEFEPTEYVRKVFTVRAHEVTFQNVDKVAKWCNGKTSSEPTRVLGGAEVHLPIVVFPGQGADKGKELVAKLGNYVVQFKNRFQVYKEPQFFATFEQKVVLQEEEPHGVDENGECKDCGLMLEDVKKKFPDAVKAKIACDEPSPCLADGSCCADGDQERDDALHKAGQLEVDEYDNIRSVS
jgi:hypothetical protein